MSDVDKIKMLEATLAVCQALDSAKARGLDIMERALRQYAAGETNPNVAKKALGIGEWWDYGWCKDCKALGHDCSRHTAGLPKK